MNDWVNGPVMLTDRTVDVYEGTVCVILRNGQVFDVRGPGRHGGLLRLLNEDRRLPVSGSLSLLTFEHAPAVSAPVVAPVRLRDGSTVTVTMKAAIVPLWQKDSEAVISVVRRYGVQPERIQEAAQLELEESLRVMATQSLAQLAHDEVHAHADARTLMRLPEPTGLLTVGHLISCTISRDRHLEQSLTVFRDGGITALRESLEAQLALVRATNQNEVAAIQRRGELEGRMETALAEADVNSAVAKILGVSTVDAAYPGQRSARLQAQYETIRAVLENNMDLLPLLSDPTYGNATTALTDLMAGLFSENGRRTPADGRSRALARPTATAATPAPTSLVGSPIRLLRRASTPGPSETFEVLLIESSTDQVVGAITSSGPHRLMIGHAPDPVDVSMRALAAAATWCGGQVGARVLARESEGTPGKVSVTKVDSGSRPPHQDVEQALGAWIVAINSLMAGRVEVSIGA